MSDFWLIVLFGAVLVAIFGAMNFVAAKQYYDGKKSDGTKSDEKKPKE